MFLDKSFDEIIYFVKKFKQNKTKNNVTLYSLRTIFFYLFSSHQVRVIPPVLAARPSKIS